MANQAKYIIHIPTVDNRGNELVDLATAAHHWLFYGPGPKIEGSFIEGPVRGNWRDDPQETFTNLVTYAEESPEMDSTMKQLAQHIAEASNQWGMFVVREGKGAPQSWVVNNPQYREGEGAESWAIRHGDHTVASVRLLDGSLRPLPERFRVQAA